MKNITKFQEPAKKLAWQHNDPLLQDPLTFVSNWLHYRKDTFDKNWKEFKGKRSYEKLQNNAQTVLLSDTTATEDREPYYRPITHDIVLHEERPLKTEGGDNDYVHENTHGIFRFFQNTPISKKVKQILNGQITNKAAKDVYPVLMEIRFRHKMDPNHTFTVEDILQLKEEVNSHSDTVQTKFINQFQSKEGLQKLADLFNLIADSGQKQTGSVSSAQQGTKLLTPHKDYLGIPYKQDGDYDYFSAHPENMPAKPEEHWTSRNPVTGQLLKSENHPTFNLLLNGEQEAGMQIYRGLNGELYSYPKEQQVPLYLKKYNYGNR